MRARIEEEWQERLDSKEREVRRLKDELQSIDHRLRSEQEREKVRHEA